jgi:murein DD-endopeptidase MepM/ murein hydrolase activator NlpD
VNNHFIHTTPPIQNDRVKKIITGLCIFFLLFIPAFLCRGDMCTYPEITSLTLADPLFRQLQDDIRAYYKAVHSKGKFPEPVLKIFCFSPGTLAGCTSPGKNPGDKKPDVTVFSLSARLNIPYDTLATLNRIENPQFFTHHPVLLIPNIPGIFVPENPSSDLEQVMVSWRMQSLESGRQVVINRHGRKERFLFFPGGKFHPVERAFFLIIKFRFPLKRGHITSSFGVRQSPFSGHPEVHNGIDIGAPEGTEVYAAGTGVVKKTGFHPVYGNFILISHANGYESFYGHLKDFSIHLNSKVYSGMVIGFVGTTGRSTGPHLHFEIRKDGSPEDPVPFLQKIEE